MACKVADVRGTTLTASAFEGLSEVFQKTKIVPDEVQKLLITINQIPEFKDQSSIQDKEVKTVVFRFKMLVETTFLLAQSYVTKCHKLADYICHEEPHTIKVINEGNVKELKDFLKDILSQSKNCQEELKTLIEFMEAERKQLICGKQAVQNKESEAETKAIAAGVAIGGGVALGMISSIVRQAPIAGIVVAVGASLLAAGAGMTWMSITEMEFYKKIVKAFQETHDNLKVIQDSLKKVNEQLKLAIDNNVLGVQGEDKMNKLKSGSECITSSILKSLGTLIKQTETIKEYCRPLIGASNSEEFFMLYQFV